MYVCLCKGVTSQTVTEVVAGGASTTKKVAKACGAGSECGRCRRTVQAIIKAGSGSGARNAAMSRSREEQKALRSKEVQS
jgi:bacterioferritin-associated ferredoxin